MRRHFFYAGGTGVLLMAAMLTWGGSINPKLQAERSAADQQRIDTLLQDMKTANLPGMQALPVERFVVPSASVDVMRVKLEETYDVQGVGKDVVQLVGWIAVVHDNARPAEGETETRWGTSISDTEFVGMDLHGESEIFGPVQVKLASGTRSTGQVGKLQLSLVDRLMADIAYGPHRGLGGVAAKPAAEPDPDPQEETQASTKGGSGDPAVRRTLLGVLSAVSNKDAKKMVTYYSKNPKNLFFNGALTSPAKGGDEYVRELSKMFQNIKTIRSIPDENMNIKISGRQAAAALTGRNEIVDNEGHRGTGAWLWTVQLERQGSTWIISHDHLSFTSSRSDLKEIQRPLGVCGANANVAINMPKLDLRMRTANPVLWYSEVETIPPVGHTASISFTPTPLMMDNRQIATLTSGVVKFREVVRHVPLDGTNWRSMIAKR